MLTDKEIALVASILAASVENNVVPGLTDRQVLTLALSQYKRGNDVK